MEAIKFMNESMRISNLMLERYNLGEVNDEERERIETALKTDTALLNSLAGLRKEDDAFRKAHPYETTYRSVLAADNLRGAGRAFRPYKKGNRIKLPQAIWGAAAAALLLAATLPMLLRDKATDRMKGSAELSLYLKTDNSRVENHVILSAGDTVQLAYMVDKNLYGVIFSIDGRSEVTVHYPYNVMGNTELTPGKRIALDEAYTLDDAPKFEVFFLVASDKPLNVMRVLDSAKTLARDSNALLEDSRKIFSGYEVYSLSVIKE